MSECSTCPRPGHTTQQYQPCTRSLMVPKCYANLVTHLNVNWRMIGVDNYFALQLGTLCLRS